MSVVKIKDRDNLVKNLDTGAVINTDTIAYEKRIKIRFEAQRQNLAAQQQEPFQRISFGTEVLAGLPFGGQTISQIPVTPANPFLQFAGGIGALGTGIGTLLEGLGSFRTS